MYQQDVWYISAWHSCGTSQTVIAVHECALGPEAGQSWPFDSGINKVALLKVFGQSVSTFAAALVIKAGMGPMSYLCLKEEFGALR